MHLNQDETTWPARQQIGETRADRNWYYTITVVASAVKFDLESDQRNGHTIAHMVDGQKVQKWDTGYRTPATSTAIVVLAYFEDNKWTRTSGYMVYELDNVEEAAFDELQNKVEYKVNVLEPGKREDAYRAAVADFTERAFGKKEEPVCQIPTPTKKRAFWRN